MLHLSAKKIHTQTPKSAWDSRLTHVLQRSVGTNFPSNMALLDNHAAKYTTVRRTNLIILSRFPLHATLIATLTLYFNGSEITTYLIRNQIYNKSRKSVFSLETFHDMPSYWTFDAL